MKTSFPASKQKWIPTTGIYPLGFKTTGLCSGVKQQKNDIALVSSKYKCAASAVFTTNKFAAAPVQVSKQLLKDNSPIWGVVVNSGCANACTGEQGLKDAQTMANHFLPNKVLVMSTGVIGQKLQMDKITAGLTKAQNQVGDQHKDWMSCAEGIMTTDTFPKLISREFKTQTGSYRMAGWSKGAGMSILN